MKVRAILLCTAKHYDASVIATGDKRCLRAILSSPACRPLVDELAGRLICLEQIVERLIAVYGFPYVRDKVVPTTGCDTALRAIFGRGLESQPENVILGLRNYVDEIRLIREDALMTFSNLHVF